MSGLVLKLRPNEKFIVNGVVIENGPKAHRIRICDDNARVLRCSDAIKPEQATSPVKKLYYGIQLLITGDLPRDTETLAAVNKEINALEAAFAGIGDDLFQAIKSAIDNARYYSALCSLKRLILIENTLLDVNNNQHQQQKVA